MSAGFTLTVDADQVVAGLRALRAFGEDLTPTLEEIGMEGEESTRLRFETNLAPDGTPWKPSLRAQVKGGKTLVENRYLQDSIHYELDGSTAVEWGSNLVYAAIHQTGGTITAKNGKGLSFTLATGEHALVQSVHIPKREYLGLSEENKGVILEIVGEGMVRALRGQAVSA